LSRMIGRMTLAEAKARRELLEQQITEATQKSYQSPMVREGVIQSLIREYESARLDEKRDHPFVVQVDPAQAPELKSKPKKALIAIIVTLATFFFLLIFVFVRQALHTAQEDPQTRDKLTSLKKLFRQQWKSAK
jgi:LPS O-antigen subunit length determinant protein (WzzB/FepE family)